MFKKLFTTLLVIFLISTSIATIVIASNSSGGDKKNHGLEVMLMKQDEALKNKTKILNIVSSSKKYEDTYAGAFIDEDGILNINFVGEANEEIKLEGVKYQKVKYSLKHLLDVTDDLTKRMDELGITMIELDEEHNKVYVHVNDLDNKKQAKIYMVNDSTAIEFVDQKLEIQFTATEVINGNKSYINSTGRHGTIGFAAKDSSGNLGIVTHGHGINSGDKIKYKTSGGSEIGSVSKVKLGGKIDAAFVELKTGWFSSYKPTRKFMNGDSYVNAYVNNSEITQGQYLEAYGSVSGKTKGKVLSANVSYNLEGVSISNAVKADYKAVRGDSGAAVRYYRYGGSASSNPFVMGVQSASALDSNGNWIPGESYTLFTTVNNIFSDLGLSNP